MELADVSPKLFIVLIISALTIGCGNQPTNIGSVPDSIGFSTDRAYYAVLDTIRLSLKNNSSSDIDVGLKCGSNLEMSYQKRDVDGWGDTLWFPYMALRCLTLSDTVKVNTTLVRSLPAEIFTSAGTFRLIVNVYAPETAAHLGVVSNSFQVQ